MCVQLECTFIQSHSDFHADLYPETPGDIPAMTAKEWLGGANDKVRLLLMYIVLN